MNSYSMLISGNARLELGKLTWLEAQDSFVYLFTR